jgi:hypothetical protein
MLLGFVRGHEDDLSRWHDPVRVVVGEADSVPRGYAPTLADAALLHRVHAALAPVAFSQSPAWVGAPVDCVNGMGSSGARSQGVSGGSWSASPAPTTQNRSSSPMCSP